ncbi:MAG: hypothetical protein FJ399_07840, partial [Verrucomicrobia bacterium]|nr:hypothetical protein [Verrucomicrobiota bacterium]
MSARNLPGPAVLRKVARWCTSLAWSALILAEAPAGVYLTSYSFNSSQPPLVYTDEVMPACYKLRVKILGVPGYGNGFHAATSFNNDWVALQALPNAGTYTAELYWLKYDTGCTNLQEIGPFSAVTISIWPPDTTAPTVPASLVASNFATNSLTIGWTASFDAFGVTGYEVFRNATSLGTVATTSMTVSGLTAGTAYSFTVRARDAAGNWSAQSASLAAATIIDTTPPSQPTNLASSNVTPVSAVVSWNASTDNTGVSGYEVFRNGSSLGRVAGTTYTFTALSPSTGYQFQVRAFDGAGNASTTSSALEVTTLAPDTTIPTVPTNLAIAEIDATSVRLTWNPSTDDVGVTGYEVFSNGNSAGIVTGTTMTVGSLSQLTVYAFTVRAKDASNNWSAQCSPVSGRTWQRVYSSSGTIWNGEEWDEQTQQYTYNPSSDWHNFPLASSGSVRAFTTGTTDTRGDLEGSTASSGGEGGNFLIATTKSAGSRSLLVEGEYEQTQGDYGVAVDFRGANATPSASFVATPLTGRAPLVVALDGSASSDPDGQIASHAWDFDNNGTTDATGVTTVATFSNNTTSPQTFTTKLIVTDLDGGTANATRTITVYPASSYAVSVNNGTSSVPFQQAGSTVSLVAAAPPAGLQFGQWVLVSGSGTFASSTASSTTFTVGSADTVVRAVFLADTTPPSTPSAVTLTNFTADSMSVSWTVATDNVGVTAYEIYRNGVLAGTSTGTSTTIGQLASSTVYQISVRARDAAGNRSAHSQMATGKTWVRLYSAAGTIYNGWSYDEETNTWSYNPTEDSHPFVVPVAGSIKAYTRGTTDTCGYSTWTSDVCSGGDYGNFLITATASPCYAMVYVRGQYESTEGAYTVFVDLKPDANTAPTALFSAAPASGRAPLLVSFDGAPAYDLDGAIAGYAWDFDDNGST